MKKNYKAVREQKLEYGLSDAEVTRKEFNLLTSEVRKLAQAQRSSEIRLTRLEEAVEKLAQAQKDSEVRLTRLEQAVERLEQSVEKLAQAQKDSEVRLTRLEEAVEKLAQAQMITEESLMKLTVEVKSLSDRFGFTLEELGRELLPAYFRQHFGIEVWELNPQWFTVDSRIIEINFYGEGTKDGQEIILLGESQSRISYATIENFANNFKKIESVIKKNTFRFAFGFSIHPFAVELANKENIKLIATYHLRSKQ
ncbi:MAG: hypothetical protein QME68_05405 [Elusimicrobiota bacterium]|nr:hypothetical protein [Elusimicrobiota bacterium]